MRYRVTCEFEVEVTENEHAEHQANLYAFFAGAVLEHIRANGRVRPEEVVKWERIA